MDNWLYIDSCCELNVWTRIFYFRKTNAKEEKLSSGSKAVYSKMVIRLYVHTEDRLHK